MCPICSGVVLAVVVSMEAEALDSRGWGLLFPAMVHVDLHMCSWRANARSLQQVCPVWGSVVPAVVVRTEAWALGSRGCQLSCPAMVHVGQHVYLWLWRAAARNFPQKYLIWDGAALAEEVLEEEVALAVALRLPL